MDAATKALGGRIRLARTSSGIAQWELGDRCGMGSESQSRISLYERGKRDMKVSMVISLAEILNVSDYWLLTGKGKMEVS